MKTKHLVPRNLRVPRGIAQVTVQVVREAPLPYGTVEEGFPACDTPDKAAGILRAVAPLAESWDWDREQFAVLLLSTRRRAIGWQLLATGTLDTILVHPRDVFRSAIIANASAVVVAHNHPSGDPAPSEADIRVTRELHRAGQLLKIDLLDHVIVASPSLQLPGTKGWVSLRELGYLYN